MIIYGAGAAGIETLAMLFKETKIRNICFFDNDSSKQSIQVWKYGFPVIHTEEDLLAFIHHTDDNRYLVTVGHSRLREKMVKKISKLPVKPYTYISKHAWVLNEEAIDHGSVIHPNTFTSFQSSIGKFVSLHVNTTVGHKVKIGDYINIGPGCNIIGPCTIDSHCFIGAGSILYPGVKIGKQAIISAGSIIKNDIPDYYSV